MQLTTERVRLNSRKVKRIYFEASGGSGCPSRWWWR